MFTASKRAFTQRSYAARGRSVLLGRRPGCVQCRDRTHRAWPSGLPNKRLTQGGRWFEDRGGHQLKEIHDRWRLFAVREPEW